MSIKLVADGGEITVGARVAVYTYGAFNVVLPEGRELAQDDYTDDGYTNGYVYRPKGTEQLGRFDIAFARADVTVETNAGYSNFEAVVDASQRKVSEDVYFERDITGAGLGGWTPGKDYKVGDMVDVLVFNRVIPQPVTAITYTSTAEDPLGVRVHVGGQTIRDDELVSEQNRAIKEAIAKESATRRAQNKQTTAAASAAVETADVARREVVAARSDATNAVVVAGRAVVDTAVEFAPSTSRVEAPVSGWSQAYPGDGAGELWQRTVTWFGDGRVERSTPVLVTGRDGVPGPKGETGATGATGPRGATGARGPQGPKGDTGKDGVPGKDGVGVHDTTITYAASASGTQAPASGWGAQPPAGVPAGQFVWTKTTLHYTDSTTEDIYTVGKIGETGPQGAKGATGATGATGPRGPKGDTGNDGRPGKDGTKLTSTAVTYAVSTSGTTAPSSGWQVQPPAAAPGQFVWTRFVWKYSDNTNETGYSVGKIGDTGPRGPQGAKGATGGTGPQGPRGDQGPKGATGAQGVSVLAVVRLWKWGKSRPELPPDPVHPNGWSTSQPAYQVGQILWTTILTQYTNMKYEFSTPTEEASVSAATAIAAESASTKNRVWYSSTAPGSTRGERPGDTWFQYSGNTVVGQWRWTGTSWAAQTIGDQVIANLDAGKINAGILDARYIGAGSIDASKIKADSITVRELRAGTIVPIGTSLIVSEPPTSGATPEPIWWQQPGLGTVIDGATGNYAAPLGNQYKYSSGGTTAPPTRLVKVQPGKKYRLRFWTWAVRSGSRLYIEMRDKNGGHAVKSGAVSGYVTPKKETGNWGGWAGPRWDYTGSARGAYLVENLEVPTVPTLIESIIEFKPEVEWVKLFNFYWSHPNGVETVQYLAGLTLDLDVVDQAQIDALQNRQIADNKAIIKRLDYLSTSIRAVGPDEWCTDRELGYGVIMPRNNRYMVLLRTKKFKESLQSINAVVFYSNKVKHYCMGYYREGIPGNSTPAWGPVKLGGAINVDRNALDFIQRELGTTDLEMAHFFVELGDVKSAIILAGA